MATILSIFAPAEGKLFAAYRPIRVSCMGSTAGGQNKVVYCDIYANGTYYKTLTSTSGQLMAGAVFWAFDLQDAAQELVKPVILPVDHDTPATCQDAFVALQVKFRGSTTDAFGFIVPDGPVPVQGTMDFKPVAGGGIASNVFYALNASLKHEDNQDLQTHLSLYNEYYYNSANIKVLTLSHRPAMQYLNGPNENDQIGIMFPWKANKGTNNYVTLRMQLGWRTKAGVPGAVMLTTPDNYTVPMTYSIPCGLNQLKSLDWAAGVPWDDIANYNVGLRTEGNFPQFIWRSPQMVQAPCNAPVRIRFLNYLGMFDSAVFHDVTEALKTKSSTFERALLGAPVGNKAVSGRNRYNVRSGKVMDMTTTKYAERAMPWLSELFDSPLAFKEWGGGQLQDPSLWPVVIQDGDMVEKKREGRIIYETQITAAFSNENIRQRN